MSLQTKSSLTEVQTYFKDLIVQDSGAEDCNTFSVDHSLVASFKWFGHFLLTVHKDGNALLLNTDSHSVPSVRQEERWEIVKNCIRNSSIVCICELLIQGKYISVVYFSLSMCSSCWNEIAISHAFQQMKNSRHRVWNKICLLVRLKLMIVQKVINKILCTWHPEIYLLLMVQGQNLYSPFLVCFDLYHKAVF